MNAGFLKSLDRILGPVVCSIPPLPPAVPCPDRISSLLVIRPGGIGDAVLLAPAIRLIKSGFPHIRITILAEMRNVGIFRMIPGVDRVCCYDRPAGLLGAMRGRYDAVIDSEQWHHLSALVARYVSAPVKIGFGTNVRRRMFTHVLPYSHDIYEAESFISLLQPLGIALDAAACELPWLSIPDHVHEQIAARLAGGWTPMAALFPGASIPERRWGADRFRRLAEMIEMLGVRVVVIGGKGDMTQGREIAAGSSRSNLAGLLTLEETAAVIQRSSLLVSADSGLLHIAVALGTPTVSLFGPGRSLKWAPSGDRHSMVSKGMECSPCTTYGTTPSCGHKVKCMNEISVAEVFKAASALLSRKTADGQ